MPNMAVTVMHELLRQVFERYYGACLHGPDEMNPLIKRFTATFLFALPILAISSVASAEVKRMPGWDDKKQAQAVSDCRSNTRAEFRNFYLEEEGFTEENFPADKEAQFEEWITPIVGTCACIIETIAGEMTFNEYASFSPKVIKRFNDLIAVGGVCLSEQVAQKKPPEEPGSGCVRYLPDRKGFPYASIDEARLTLEERKYVGGNVHEKEGITWAFYERPEGGLDVDVTYFGPASPFESAIIWRRPSLDVTPNAMLVSARCESTAERCAQFEKFLQEVEFKRTMGECPVVNGELHGEMPKGAES